jgi:hypothetical protein
MKNHERLEGVNVSNDVMKMQKEDEWWWDSMTFKTLFDIQASVVSL